MPPLHAFISYSHIDEKHLERLHKHMAMLQRDDTIETWSDHKIIPGSKVGQEIDNSLSSSGLFIALVSPDYLASNYCYETEFQQALAMEKAGKLRIVPVILEPCDWLSSPFREFMALPKDGKAISEWTNHNVAYLDVVKGLRRVVEADEPAARATNGAPVERAVPAAMRRLKVKQEFDAIQRSDFADEAFAAIRDYFRNSCGEINGLDDLKAKFEIMSDTAFTCTVVNRGMMRGRGEGHITVRNDKGGRPLRRHQLRLPAPRGGRHVQRFDPRRGGRLQPLSDHERLYEPGGRQVRRTTGSGSPLARFRQASGGRCRRCLKPSDSSV